MKHVHSKIKEVVGCPCIKEKIQPIQTAMLKAAREASCGCLKLESCGRRQGVCALRFKLLQLRKWIKRSGRNASFMPIKSKLIDLG